MRIIFLILLVLLAGGMEYQVISAPSPDYAPPPGALNPQVVQANISQTICVRGWTKTIRPPVSYTNALKLKQMAVRHLPGIPSTYEEDHLVALELGGHPTDPMNLWPQAWPQARVKDKWENSLNRAVCALRMTLSVAQQKIRDPKTWR
jgi:hypothetical protein